MVAWNLLSSRPFCFQTLKPIPHRAMHFGHQTGFTDGNAYIRELTLKSMLALAPRMSNKTLTQNVLKHLSKLQVWRQTI